MWEFARGSATAVSTPPHFQVARSNRCNFKCVYCSHHRVGNQVPRTELGERAWTDLEPVIDRSTLASFHGISEFMIDPKFFEIIERCARAGTDLMINTNGSVCTPRHLDALGSYPGMLMMNFSVDAATPETFLRIRGKDFDKIIENISRYVSRLRARERRESIGLTFVVLKGNVHEMEDFLRLAKRLGVCGVRFHRQLEYDGLDWKIPTTELGTFDYRGELPEHYREEFNATIARCETLARELGIGVELPAPLGEPGTEARA